MNYKQFVELPHCPFLMQAKEAGSSFDCTRCRTFITCARFEAQRIHGVKEEYINYPGG